MRKIKIKRKFCLELWFLVYPHVSTHYTCRFHRLCVNTHSSSFSSCRCGLTRQRGLVALLWRETKELAALTAWVLPPQPTETILLPVLELPLKPLPEEALLYLTHLTVKIRIFPYQIIPPSFPLLKKQKVIRAKITTSFLPPPTRFFHLIKCYAYALPTPKIPSSF